MQYKDVVKAMFAKHSGKMAPKDIMKMAAAEYRKMKGTGQMHSKRMPRGGGVIGDLASPVVGIADSLGSLFGLGLDEGKGMKKGRKRMPRGGYMSAGALSAVDIEPQAMTPGDGAFAMVPMNPRVLSDNAMGGNILNSVSRFLPYMALLA